MQVLQWVFAAMPGHPVLRQMCEHINNGAGKVFSPQESFDTLERTGPGVWTDIVLHHASSHALSNVSCLSCFLPTIGHLWLVQTDARKQHQDA